MWKWLAPVRAAAEQTIQTSKELAQALYGWNGSLFRGARRQTLSRREALNAPVVLASMRVTSESVARMPLHLMTKPVDGTMPERVFDHPVLDLLERPNDEQTGLEFRTAVVVNLLLHGNAFIQLKRSRLGVVRSMWLLPFDAVEVLDDDLTDITQPGGTAVTGGRRPRQRSTWEPDTYYRVTHPDGAQDEWRAASGRILHIRSMSVDGTVGESTIQRLMGSIEMLMLAEKYGQTMFLNRNQPGGILKFRGRLSPERKAALKAQADIAKGDDAHRTLLLEDDADWVSTQDTNDRSQVIETRRFQREEVLLGMGVPPPLVGLTDGTTALGRGVDALGLLFLTYRLGALVENVEQAFGRALLRPEEMLQLVHVTSAITRGDMETNRKAADTLVRAGLASLDEGRKLWDPTWDPMPDGAGERFLDPENMGGGNTATGDTGPGNNDGGGDDSS